VVGLPRLAIPHAAIALVLVAACCTHAAGDVIHLKNGGTIVADSWERRGDDLLVRQGQGSILVPRADVARIEATPPSGDRELAATPAQRTAPAAHPANQPPAGAPRAEKKPDRQEILDRIRDLEQRLRDFPQQRAETTRTLVTLLTYLASEAFARSEFDEALARLRSALGYDPHDADALLGLAATYIALEQELYARSTLERAVLDHPEDARLLALLGDVYNNEERPEEALAAWQKALALKSDHALREKIAKLQREHAVDEAYRRSDAAHFTLKYDGEVSETDLGGEIIGFLEARFADLVTRFDYYPSQPIVVIVYPQRQFYEATDVDSSVGGLFDGKIRVPGGGLKRLSPEARAVLLHELAHAFVAGKSRYTAPRWLHEGIAQMIEGRTSPASTSVALAREFERLGGSPDWGSRFTYPMALSFVEFLVEQQGFFRLLDVLDKMADGASEDEAFRSAMRDSLADLRQAWGAALAERHLH
jgi:tetratricopeptide (TPR) repeat protein